MPDEMEELAKRFVEIADRVNAINKLVATLSAKCGMPESEIKITLKKYTISIEHYSGFYFTTSRLPSKEECDLINAIGYDNCIELAKSGVIINK